MSESAPLAFVTGGTGFIGSHLVEELLRRGFAVRALVRKEPRWLAGLPVEPVHADFSDIERLWEALRGVDFVFHNAGVTRAKDYETFERVNVKGTLNLLGAVRMAAPDVRRVLVTSSLAAVGRTDVCPATPASALNPVSRYGRSKLEMERAIMAAEIAGAKLTEALPLTVVRPSSVYGPRESDIFTMIESAQKGVFPILGSGSAPALSLVHARDLVRGMVDAALSETAAGGTYFLGSLRQYTWREVADAVSDALGRGVWKLPVPRALVRPVGAMVELGGRLVGKYPPLNREKAREALYACAMCDSSPAARDFDYRQRISLEDGMKETVAWYRQEGWLRSA